jgi:hypothetical protein
MLFFLTKKHHFPAKWYEIKIEIRKIEKITNYRKK